MKIIGVKVYIVLFLGIGFSGLVHNYWKQRSSLSDLLEKEIHFIQSKNNQNYTLILKGK